MLDFVCVSGVGVCVCGGGRGRRGEGGGKGGNYELLCRNHSFHYVITNVIKCKPRLYSRIVHIIPKLF